MDEKQRRIMEQQALARQDKEREERRKKEEIERRRRAEDHERYRMQQMAIEKQNAERKAEELKISKKNDLMLDELEQKKNEEFRQQFTNQQSQQE